MRTLFITVCIVAFFCGCEKNDEPNQKTEKYIIAGLGDDSNIKKIFPSFISICEKIDYHNGTTYGMTCASNDFLDLDLDDINDFKFEQNFTTSTPCNCDTTILDDCETYGEEESIIKALSGFQIAFDSEETIAPMKFSLYDTINMYDHWTNENSSLHFSWDRVRFWEYSETTGYLGIRMIKQDTIYGWIKIDVTEGLIIIDEYFLDE